MDGPKVALRAVRSYPDFKLVMEQKSTDDFSRVYVLYGALRSGTTLVRLLLDHHPEITCPGERDFMLDYQRGGPSGKVFDLDSLSRDRIFQNSGLGVPKSSDMTAAFEDLLKQQLQISDRVLIVVLHRHLDRFLDQLPNCRIIHLVRDPRDVARSSIGMGWAGTTWHGIRHWLETEQGWDRVRHRLKDAQVKDVRYEDLIIDPQAGLDDICAFMGLNFHPDMMKYDQNSTYDAIDPALIFQWKKKQTPDQINDVEHRCGALLTERGYTPSGHGTSAPSALRLAALWLKNKRHTWRHRIERYGLVDSILVSLAQRMGMPRLGLAAQNRIDQITQKNLK